MHRTSRVRPIVLGLTVSLLCAPAIAQQQQASQRQAPASRPAIQPARVPEGVRAHRDLAYTNDGHVRQKLDLYVPDEASEPLPLIIWVHGGGWQGGSKDGCPPLGAGYTSRGYAVASIGYRLSGDAIFPAQIEDCKAAIRWLRAHADEYGLDANRFGVWGSSAGGHLVALLGTSGDVSEFDVGEHLDQSSRVQAVCDYYGPTDLLVFVRTPRYERHAQAGSPESKLLGGTVEEIPDKAARANPITYVTRDDPPYLIVHGDSDRTVPPNQSELLHAALEKAGVESKHHVIAGAGHGGPGFSAPEVRAMVDDFFERHLKSAAQAFRRTRVIGYSQVGGPRGGWFVVDGVFESIVGDDRWELLWAGGAGVDRWRDRDFAGWSRPLVSPCPGDAPPDRVLLSVSGPYGSDEAAWAEAIEATLVVIHEKIPTARQIILQPVVGSADGQPCPVPAGARAAESDRTHVRASVQHAHIVNAIHAVVKKHAGDEVEIIAGFEPKVRSCADYVDAVGHLTPEAAVAVGRAAGEHYAKLDAQGAAENDAATAGPR